MPKIIEVHNLSKYVSDSNMYPDVDPHYYKRQKKNTIKCIHNKCFIFTLRKSSKQQMFKSYCTCGCNKINYKYLALYVGSKLN